MATCLTRLQVLLGGSVYAMRGMHHSRNASGRAQQLHVSGDALTQALPAVLPYLVGKRLQAELLLAFLIDCPATPRERVTERQLAVREAYFLHLKELKHS